MERPIVGKLTRPASGLQKLRPKPKPGAAVRNQRRWKTLSRWYRASHPVCEHCGENLSDEVHHRVPVGDAPHLAYAPANLLALCRPCHAEMHGKRSRFAPLRFEPPEGTAPPPIAQAPPPPPPPCRSMYEPSFVFEPASMYERHPGLG